MDRQLSGYDIFIKFLPDNGFVLLVCLDNTIDRSGNIFIENFMY
jgi:hypothetical protein